MTIAENATAPVPSHNEESREQVPVERRIQARIEVDIPIVVEVGSSIHDCRLADVSVDGAGAFVAGGSIRVDIGEHVRLSVPERGVSGKAGVRRVVDERGFGVEFDDTTIGAIVAGYAKGVV